MTGTLTREQRATIFAGGAPRIAGQLPCPWEPGDIYRASAHVELTVLEIRTPKKGGWSLRYAIRDTRDPARLIRPNPHPVDLDAIRDELKANGGYPVGRIDDPAVSRDAGIESAYTSNRGLAEEGVGEAVGEGWLARFAAEATDSAARERRVRRAAQATQKMERRLAEYRAEAAHRRIDIRNEMRLLGRLQKQGKPPDGPVEGIRRKLDRDLDRVA